MPITFLSKIPESKHEGLRKRVENEWTASGACHEWTGKKNHTGYGVIGKLMTHRLAYALLVTDFELGAFICHHCDNPACINPNHLYVGDSKSNGKDAANRKRVVSRSIYQPKSHGKVRVEVREKSPPSAKESAGGE